MAVIPQDLKRKFEAAIFGRKRVQNMAFRWINENNARVFSDYGDHRFIYDPSEFIGRRLFETGVFQRSNVETVFECCRSHGLLEPGGVFLEIGANIGTQTVYASLSHQFDRIVAVEPDPVNLVAIRANVAVNELRDYTTIIPAGLSDGPGSMTLRRNVFHSGMSTVEPPVEGAQVPDTEGEFEISMMTCDALLEAEKIAPEDVRLVWMDVEGHEPKALRGMSTLLEAKTPVFFEYSPRRMSEEEMDWIDAQVLDTYGTVYSFTDRLAKLDTDSRSTIRATPDKLDILALP